MTYEMGPLRLISLWANHGDEVKTTILDGLKVDSELKWRRVDIFLPSQAEFLSMPNNTSTVEVVTVFLRHDAEILLTRHSGEIEPYKGLWTGLSRPIEDSPEQTARQVIADETGLLSQATLARVGDTVSLDDMVDEVQGTVYPLLFDSPTRGVDNKGETKDREWVSPTEILRRKVAPGLWESYDRIRPTPATIKEDTKHGSAYISIRAMEVIRDVAGLASSSNQDAEAQWRAVAQVAEELLRARPSMTALTNRVNRIMSRASEEESTNTVETIAIEEIESALVADRNAAKEAIKHVQDKLVLTLSRSGTLYPALVDGPDRVLIAESRPAREGVDVAERLAQEPVEVTLFTDAAIAHVLSDMPVDAVLVGADTVLRDGDIVNKTGTRGTAIAAADAGVPVYAVTAADKINPKQTPELETGPPEEIYDGEQDIQVKNPTFDVTPAEFITAVVTERGALDTDEVTALANEHADLSEWMKKEKD